jgi:hypothetical protein
MGTRGWWRAGATVVQDRAGRRYAKVVASDRAEELASERDRIDWLSSTGVPGDVVLDWLPPMRVRAWSLGRCRASRRTDSTHERFDLPGLQSSRWCVPCTVSPPDSAPSTGAWRA